MSEFNVKEVRFDIWCPTCLYFDVDDTKGEEPCNECLTESARLNITKPLKHKAKAGKTLAKG